MKFNKNLIFFLFCHFIIWGFLPLIRNNLPMDSAEALIWGFIGEWGSNKHPPMSGFFADLIYNLSGNNPYSLYFLSQIFVCLGLFYVYKLARLFLPSEKAVISALILEGVAYYSFVTPEYNVNMIALFLWPITSYYFVLALRQNKLFYWLLFGFFAGLNLLTKYISGFLLLSMGLYLLFTPKGRQTLKSYKIYLGALLAFVVITPHIIWLYNHDFFVFDYFLGRSSSAKILPYGIGHIFYPLKFLVSQILTSLLALIILFSAYFKGQKSLNLVSKEDKTLVFYLGILPVLLMSSVALIAGIKLKSMWGSPCLYMLGIAFFIYFSFDIKNIYHKILKACYLALFLFSTAFLMQLNLTNSAKFKLNALDFTQTLKAEDFSYVGGSVWLSSTLGVFAYNHPQVLFLMEAKQNPWIDIQDVAKKGILVVEENLNMYHNYQKTFAKLPEPKVYLLKSTNILGKSKEYKLYYGVIKGDL